MTTSILQSKITILVPSFRDGGVERVILNISRGFLDRGHAVDLVCIDDANGPFKGDIPDAVRLVEFKAAGTVSALPAMIRYLRVERPAVVLAFLNPANMLAVFARALSGVQTRVVLDVQVSVRPRETTSRLKALLRPTLYRLVYPHADMIVAASGGIADDLASFGLRKDKVAVIYNPVVVPGIAALAAERAGHPWFDDAGVPVIVAAGRLHKQKGFPTLLRAFAIARKDRALRLVVIGEGEECAHLEALSRELGVAADVAFVGFVHNPYSYMAHAALFVLSSAWEGFGNVVGEALAVGTSVVSTDCPWGPAEILENGKYGTLVPVGDHAKLATAMLAKLAAPDDSVFLKRGAERFTVDFAVAEYLKALNISNV